MDSGCRIAFGSSLVDITPPPGFPRFLFGHWLPLFLGFKVVFFFSRRLARTFTVPRVGFLHFWPYAFTASLRFLIFSTARLSNSSFGPRECRLFSSRFFSVKEFCIRILFILFFFLPPLGISWLLDRILPFLRPLAPCPCYRMRFHNWGFNEGLLYFLILFAVPLSQCRVPLPLII